MELANTLPSGIDSTTAWQWVRTLSQRIAVKWWKVLQDFRDWEQALDAFYTELTAEDVTALKDHLHTTYGSKVIWSEQTRWDETFYMRREDVEGMSAQEWSEFQTSPIYERLVSTN